MASYPKRIDSYTTKVDLVDVDYARDINDLQDAVVNIETTLGTNPEIFNYSGVIVTSPGGDGSGGFAGASGQINSQLQRGEVDYASVAARLDAIERGGVGGQQGNAGLPCFHMETPTAIAVPPVSGTVDQAPADLAFPTPNPLDDPYSMYDGAGITTPRQGFWAFHASICYSLQGTGNQNTGIYEIAIDDGNWVRGANRTEHTVNGTSYVFLQTHRMGFWNAGYPIRVATLHNSAVTQSIYRAVFSGFLVKDTTTSDPGGYPT